VNGLACSEMSRS